MDASINDSALVRKVIAAPMLPATCVVCEESDLTELLCPNAKPRDTCIDCCGEEH